jgi:hypothetical protein
MTEIVSELVPLPIDKPGKNDKGADDPQNSPCDFCWHSNNDATGEMLKRELWIFKLTHYQPFCPLEGLECAPILLKSIEPTCLATDF